MNIRYARATDKNQIVSLWNYCFEDGEDFVKYYFENVYDENNTIIIEENDLTVRFEFNIMIREKLKYRRDRYGTV